MLLSEENITRCFVEDVISGLIESSLHLNFHNLVWIGYISPFRF